MGLNFRLGFSSTLLLLGYSAYTKSVLSERSLNEEYINHSKIILLSDVRFVYLLLLFLFVCLFLFRFGGEGVTYC